MSPRLSAALRAHGLADTPADGVTVDAEIPSVEGYGTTTGRAILEAASTGDVQVAWRRETRAIPPGWSLTSTDHVHGAVAVYVCEPEGDDGPIENGLIDAASPGQDLGVWRVW